MTISEDISLYLPKFLSSEAKQELFSCLNGFPDNINERFYTNYLKDEEIIFQGDGIKDLLVVNIPDQEI